MAKKTRRKQSPEMILEYVETILQRSDEILDFCRFDTEYDHSRPKDFHRLKLHYVPGCAAEIFSDPKLRKQFLSVYEEDPSYYDKFQLSGKTLVIAKDHKAFRQISAVLLECANEDSRSYRTVCDLCSKTIAPLLYKHEDLLSDVARTELPEDPVEAVRKMYSSRLMDLLDAFDASVVREYPLLLKYLLFLELEHESLYWLCFIETLCVDTKDRIRYVNYVTPKGSLDPKADKAFFSELFRSSIFKEFGDYICRTVLRMQEMHKHYSVMHLDYTNILSWEARDHFLPGFSVEEDCPDDSTGMNKEALGEHSIASGKVICHPDNIDFPFDSFFRAAFGSFIKEMPLYGVDIMCLMSMYPLSQKDLRDIVAKTSIRLSGYEADYDTYCAQALFAETFVSLYTRELLLRALRDYTGREERKTSETKSSEGKASEGSEELLEAYEQEKNKCIDLEKRLREREKRAREQEKIIRQLEKENADLQEMYDDINEEMTLRAEEDLPSQDADPEEEDMAAEEELFADMDMDEKRSYFEEIIEEKNVIIYGARDNFRQRMQEKYPRLIFSDIGKGSVSPAQIRKADMVVFRVDHCSHSQYYKTKKLIKDSEVPMRQMRISHFNEKYLFDAVIDMFEHC